jgi:hypothetical protein
MFADFHAIELAKRLREAADAHAKAFPSHADDDWPLWYAHHLIDADSAARLALQADMARGSYDNGLDGRT